MKNDAYLDYKTLISVLRYDENTGLFYRLKRCNRYNNDSPSGKITDIGYIYIRIKGRGYYAHRLAYLYIYKKWPKDQLDHIDGNRSNNRIANLREADNRTNQQNRDVHRNGHLVGTTLIKKYNRWMSQIQTNKKRTYLGSFGTAIEAHEAYLAALKARGC
jgi:hypothetical protein